MSDEKSKGILSSIFNKKVAWGLAKFALTTAISAFIAFYLGGLIDFTAIHEMREGQELVAKASPIIQEWLRTDIPLIGASLADGLTTMASWFPEPQAINPLEVVDTIAQDTIFDTTQANMAGF